MSLPESPGALEALQGGQLVELVYFRARGKYYSEGEFHVNASISLYEIWEYVTRLRDSGHLPGLVEGAGKEFIISIDAPGHPHEHPRLLMP